MKRISLFLIALLALGHTAWGQSLSGSGTSSDPYLITSTADWNTFASNVASGTNYYGQFLKLTADITVTTMVGGGDGSSNVFIGTFDGDGHTITFNVASATEQYIAPFRRIDGATIKNLKVAGTVSSSNRFAGGIVAYAKGTSTVTNCVNSTNITSDYSETNASNGGIVGMVGAGGELTISGYVFNGEMNGGTGHNDTWCGILGLCNSNCTATINNCLVDPVSSVAYGYTFYRSSGTTTLSNCYYTKTIGNEQGKQARTITGSNVTVAFAGTVTNYNVSGLKAYKNNQGLLYNTTLIAGDGDNVKLRLTAPDGYAVASATYTPDGGSATNMTQTGNGYSFTMPDADVTITAVLTNINWSGTGDTKEDPFIISSPAQLDLLASRVNSGTSYDNKYFKLGDEITYTYSDLADDESNFTPIGNHNRSFNGHFDGDNHTISGIRIYSDGDSQDTDSYKALFGKVGSSAVVKNITLTDADITGYQEVGGIVGYNEGTVSYCTVTNTVYIRCIQDFSRYHGGIVGYNGYNNNHAIVSHCTSSATLTTDGNNTSTHHGAIVGTNFGLISDNLAIGATVSSTRTDAGAISGNNEASSGNKGTLQRNYYVNCTVGTPNATNVGCGGSDLNNANNPDGAVPGNARTIAGYGSSTTTG